MSLAPVMMDRGTAIGGRGIAAMSRGWLLFGATILGLVPVAVLAMALMAPQGALDSLKLLGCCLAPVLFLAMLVEPRLGIALFILAAGLSPELPGKIQHLRLSDLVFFGLLLALLARGAVGGLRLSLRSPLTLPTILTLLAGVFSLYWGQAVVGRSTGFFLGLCILLKRSEYLAIFLLTANLVRSRRWADRWLVVMLVTLALAVLQGFLSAGSSAAVGGAERVTGYDRNYNTLAGFLVPNICLATALLFSVGRMKARLVIAGLLVAAVACLALSYSREGYLMLAGALLTLGALRYRVLLALVAILVVAAPWVVPAPVVDRVADTLEQIQNYDSASVGSNSLSARISAWRDAWEFNVDASPWFGVGVGNIRFSIDNEFLLRWAESGLVGLATFLWLLWQIGGLLRRACGDASDARGRSIACACLAGFVGLLIQATVAVTFSTTRSMEPFSVLLGLVWVYSRLPSVDPMADAGEEERGS